MDYEQFRDMDDKGKFNALFSEVKHIENLISNHILSKLDKIDSRIFQLCIAIIAAVASPVIVFLIQYFLK